MPTTLDRHTITETPQIAAALDVAAQVWPNESRTELMRRLIIESAERIRSTAEHRLLLVKKWAGCLTGSYPDDWAARIKDEWPE
jgi:hypothetical protein